MSNDIERELAKILARDNELRDAEASEKAKQEAAAAAAVIEWETSRGESAFARNRTVGCDAKGRWLGLRY